MTLRIDFSRSVYAVSAVEAAVAAWAQLGRFAVEAGPHTIHVVIEGAHPGVPDLLDHFANHALFLSIQEARRAAGAAA
jgi:hypothetical protein